MHPSQLPLNLAIRDESTFDLFYPGDNQALLAALQDFINNDEEPFFYLHGGPQSGRSHLLQAACHLKRQSTSAIAYIALKTSHPITPEILQGMQQYALVCLDDIDHVLQQPQWEEALFHFYNHMRENKQQLLVSANTPAAQLTCHLPDLKSRLTWGANFSISPLSDKALINTLQLRASYRGLTLSTEAGQFLLNHFPRNISTLLDILNQLDHASLITQRKLTIPFIKETLQTHSTST